MNITRRSKLTGTRRTMDIPIEREDLECWANGAMIQDAAPYLNASDREFIMTGITDDEWDKAFGEGA